MRIERAKPSDAFLDRYRTELSAFLAQSDGAALRPCPGCDLPCPCSGSPVCCCGCGADCAQAARQMSSDPDGFPIETGIVPLVFALFLMRVCRPCWSCEGHTDAQGRITRLPQVWFDAETATYPRLIYDHLHDLQFRKRIANPWRVNLMLSEHGALHPLFAIMPDVSIESAPVLASLQRDVAVIADGLAEAAQGLARDSLAGLELPPKG